MGEPGPGGGSTATLVRSGVTETRQAAPVWVTALLTLLSLVVAVGTTIMLYRIGDSGAQAVWNGVANLPAR